MSGTPEVEAIRESRRNDQVCTPLPDDGDRFDRPAVITAPLLRVCCKAEGGASRVVASSRSQRRNFRTLPPIIDSQYVALIVVPTGCHGVFGQKVGPAGDGHYMGACSACPLPSPHRQLLFSKKTKCVCPTRGGKLTRIDTAPRTPDQSLERAVHGRRVRRHESGHDRASRPGGAAVQGYAAAEAKQKHDLDPGGGCHREEVGDRQPRRRLEGLRAAGCRRGRGRTAASDGTTT